MEDKEITTVANPDGEYRSLTTDAASAAVTGGSAYLGIEGAKQLVKIVGDKFGSNDTPSQIILPPSAKDD